MAIKTLTVTAPSAWASAIVNLDYSGLERDEISKLNTFLAMKGLSFSDCVACKDAGFLWDHDAASITGGADCQRYTFRA